MVGLAEWRAWPTVAVVGLNYSSISATEIDAPTWSAAPSGFLAHERSVVIGHGDQSWRAASAAVMEWGVKTRSGFDVHAADGSSSDVRHGADYTLVARLGPLQIREPVSVVAVVDSETRVGFAYGTRSGHPVSGEEAFIITRDSSGSVRLTLRSLTRPASGRWRMLFPLLLIAQRWYRFRYLRAFRGI